jgi:hypothetical protein
MNRSPAFFFVWLSVFTAICNLLISHWLFGQSWFANQIGSTIVNVPGAVWLSWYTRRQNGRPERFEINDH